MNLNQRGTNIAPRGVSLERANVFNVEKPLLKRATQQVIIARLLAGMNGIRNRMTANALCVVKSTIQTILSKRHVLTSVQTNSDGWIEIRIVSNVARNLLQIYTLKLDSVQNHAP